MSEVIVATSQRLTLRHLNAEDAAFCLELYNTPAFIEFIGDKNIRSISDAKCYIEDSPLRGYQEHGFSMFCVELSDTRERVGVCGLIRRATLPGVDLGFGFLPAHWGKGYAQEASRTMIEYARDTLALEQLLAITSLDNDRSINTLSRLGFEFSRLLDLPEYDGPSKLFTVTL